MALLLAESSVDPYAAGGIVTTILAVGGWIFTHYKAKRDQDMAVKEKDHALEAQRKRLELEYKGESQKIDLLGRAEKQKLDQNEGDRLIKYYQDMLAKQEADSAAKEKKWEARLDAIQAVVNDLQKKHLDCEVKAASAETRAIGLQAQVIDLQSQVEELRSENRALSDRVSQLDHGDCVK